MTRLHDVSIGKFDQFKRVLANANLDAELVDALIRQPTLTRDMVTWVREQLTLPVPELLVPIDVQCANVRRWNEERNWGFTDAEIDDIDHSPANQRGFVVDVIAVYLPAQGSTSGIQRTFDELWQVASSVQPGDWHRRDPQLKSDEKHLRLLAGIAHKPGIRRITLNLGAHWDAANGVCIDDVRGTDSAHAEVLAAAAHFPDWVQAMACDRVPYASMPGYQVMISGGASWQNLPCLHWSSLFREMGIDIINWAGRRYGVACPAVVRGR